MADFADSFFEARVQDVDVAILEKRQHLQKLLSDHLEASFTNALGRKTIWVPGKRWWNFGHWRIADPSEIQARLDDGKSIKTSADTEGFYVSDEMVNVLESIIERIDRMARTTARLPTGTETIHMSMDDWKWLTVTDMPPPVTVAS